MAVESKAADPPTPYISHITSSQSREEEKQTSASVDELKSAPINPDRNIGTLNCNLKSRHIQFLASSGVSAPVSFVALTTALGCLVYLNVSSSSSEVFFWISNLSAVSTLLVWASISITYLRFHAGLRWNGIPRDTLPFKEPLQPGLAWFSLLSCSVVAFFNRFDAFFPGKFSAKTFMRPYIDIPIFAALFLG